MRKTRDLFKKIRDTRGTFHAMMSTIKDRNGMDLMDLTEAESEEELKSLLMKVKEESEKVG